MNKCLKYFYREIGQSESNITITFLKPTNQRAAVNRITVRGVINSAANSRAGLRETQRNKQYDNSTEPIISV